MKPHHGVSAAVDSDLSMAVRWSSLESTSQDLTCYPKLTLAGFVVDRWVIGGMATTLRVLTAVRVHVTTGFARMPAHKNLVKPKLPAAMLTITWYLNDAFPAAANSRRLA